MIEKLSVDYRYNEETFEVSCDFCDFCEEFEVMGWDGLMEEMRENGWKSIYKEGEWEHKCSACQY